MVLLDTGPDYHGLLHHLLTADPYLLPVYKTSQYASGRNPSDGEGVLGRIENIQWIMGIPMDIFNSPQYPFSI